jgi:hypothetical protein
MDFELKLGRVIFLVVDKKGHQEWNQKFNHKETKNVISNTPKESRKKRNRYGFMNMAVEFPNYILRA